MRKLIATLLAAAALTTPAMAQRDPGGNPGFRAAPERTEAQEAHAGRRSAQAPAQAPRQQFRQERVDNRQAFRQEQRNDRQAFRQDRRDDRQNVRQERVVDRQAWQAAQNQNREQFRRDRGEDARDFRRDRADDRRDFRQDRQQDRRDWQRDRQNWQRERNQWQDRNRFQNRDGYRWNNNGAWNRDWRRDGRYNWQDWRQRNYGRYSFPRYYAPRGWTHGYNRFSLGVILSAPLFSQSYWIDDPFQYQLPPAYGPYRWVRYYDDALLVDLRSGQVVDAIYDFFW
jgi:hypothetical protein